MVRFLLFFLFLPLTVSAQIINPVKWSYKLEPKAPKVGQTATLVITAEIEAGWHLYASDFSADIGPIPLTVAFEKNPGSYAPVGGLVSVDPHRYMDEVFGGEVADWKGTGVIRQKIKVLSLPLAINGTVDGQVCTDAGKCIPVTDDFNVVSFEAMQKVPPKGPSDPNKPRLSYKGEDLIVDPATGKEALLSTNDRTQVRPDSGSPATVVLDDTNTAKPQKSLLTKVDSSLSDIGALAAKEASPLPGQAESPWDWFWVPFVLGFGALLTPCVYPMMPMTVSFFTRGKQSRAKSLGLASIFGLSIIAMYVLVGVGFSFLFGGDVANDVATHWLTNVIFFAVFVAFGFSFLGYYEITLPSAWSTAADARADKGGIAGIFFMALTLVIVSFSCTGPIVSGILVQSSQGQLLQPAVSMLGFSLSFALPFAFFAAFPQLLASLPRSGGWLNMVKVIFGLVELALAFKFLSIADLAYHWHILDREVFLSIWIVILALLGFYLLGKIRFPHDDVDEKPLHWFPLTLAIAVFSFVVYLVPGLWGAPLKALSGYLPPLETQDFRPAAAQAQPVTSATPDPTCPKPRYADFLHLPHGLNGFFDLNEAKACAKATGKPIFIDFTGHGCTNCREMEARVWSDPAVLQRLRNKYTVCALYVDDRTPLPEAEQYISKVDGKLKATIGKANLDLEVERFNFNAQPLYVILSPDGELLTPPRAYDLDVQGFADFLDKGLAAGK